MIGLCARWWPISSLRAAPPRRRGPAARPRPPWARSAFPAASARPRRCRSSACVDVQRVRRREHHAVGRVAGEQLVERSVEPDPRPGGDRRGSPVPDRRSQRASTWNSPGGRRCARGRCNRHLRPRCASWSSARPPRRGDAARFDLSSQVLSSNAARLPTRNRHRRAAPREPALSSSRAGPSGFRLTRLSRGRRLVSSVVAPSVDPDEARRDWRGATRCSSRWRLVNSAGAARRSPPSAAAMSPATAGASAGASSVTIGVRVEAHDNASTDNAGNVVRASGVAPRAARATTTTAQQQSPPGDAKDREPAAPGTLTIGGQRVRALPGPSGRALEARPAKPLPPDAPCPRRAWRSLPPRPPPVPGTSQQPP